MVLRILLAASDPDLQQLVELAARGDSHAELAGVARTGSEALSMAKRLCPDIVAVGLRLLDGNGPETVAEIMIEAPAPTVLLSHGDVPELGSVTARALRSGALAVIPSPLRSGEELELASAREFLSVLEAMSQVKVVRRWRGRTETGRRRYPDEAKGTASIVCIAASTGGPAAILSVLKRLPAGFPSPILVVQHISPGFIESVAASMDAVVPLKILVAEDNTLIKPGAVYLAPDGSHLGVADRTRLRVSDDPAVNGFKPSGTHLFKSAARAFGSGTLGVVLTGMGSDGTEGLRAIREAGGRTIVQDEKSSIVFGMPGAAIAAGLADRVVALEDIAREIVRLAKTTQDGV